MRYIRKIPSERQIRAFFESFGKRVFSFDDLVQVLDKHRGAWKMAQTTPNQKLVDRLVNNDILRPVEISFGKEKPVTRYLFGELNIYELAVSFHVRSYISHYPAMFLLGLTTQIPKTIYTTFEQTLKQGQPQELTQENINRAFEKPQRRSGTAGVYEDYNIILLNGKFTSRAGVIGSQEIKGRFDYTGLERTLIDIAVRPNYSGGAFTVLEAYKRALEQDLSVNKLNAILNNISFIYPYHQCIGFYLQKAGYQGKAIDLLKRKPMAFDFYLDYNMAEKAYSPEWRLFYPKGM